MLVASTAHLDQVVGEVGGVDAYGLDTEFHGEGAYYPKLALVQLALPGRVVLVDPTTVDPVHLQPLIAGPGVAVTHAGAQDLDLLERACGARPTRVFDVQIAAGFLGYSSPSLATLVRDILDRKMEKGSQLSDWLRRPLTAEQIAYAESDVAHLLDLRAALEARLEELGRLDWAVEESRHVSRLRTSDDDITAWWRLKGAGQLRRPAHGPAQELAAWRERTARAADRPPASVLPDDVVVALAQRPPRTAADIPTSRRFDPRRLAPATVRDVMAAAARGAELGPGEIRLPPDRLPAHLQGLTSLIATWVSQQARDLAIDPALLASRRHIEAFLQDDPDAPLRHGWRAELIGQTVERIATGRAAVAYDPAGALVLVDR